MRENHRKVLVTGGTGLVGSHLLYSLIRAGEKPVAIFRNRGRKDFVRKVFGYYSPQPDELFKAIDWTEADMLDYESLRKAVNGCDRVYHCAASVSFDSSQNEAVISNNTSGTANMVKACLETGTGKLCHVSSTAALGATDGSGLTDETHEWSVAGHNTAYGISKHLSEKEVWKGISMGLEAVIVNPSVIFGPGDWNRGSSRFFSTVARGMPFYTDGVTGYVDVRDVVKSMMDLMNSPVTGERFIISSENLSFQEVFMMIAESLGVRRPFIRVPKILLSPAAALLNLPGKITGRKSGVTPENIKSAYSRVRFDNSKIIRTTGISFIPVKQSVEETAGYFLRDRRNKNRGRTRGK
mgnify:CR=1 FL=1